MPKAVKDREKKSVSTSGIWKQYPARDAKHKKEIRKRILKAIKKSREPRVPQPEPEDPLVFRLTKDIDACRQHVYATAIARHQLGYEKASNELMLGQARFMKQEEITQYDRKELTAPLQDEEFEQFAEGKNLGAVTLDQRMDVFKNTIDHEEKQLEQGMKDLSVVDSDIEKLAKEIAASERINHVNMDLYCFIEQQRGQRKLAEQLEVDRDVEKFMANIKKQAEDSIEMIKKSEEAMTLKEKEQQNRLFKVLSGNDWA